MNRFVRRIQLGISLFDWTRKKWEKSQEPEDDLRKVDRFKTTAGEVKEKPKVRNDTCTDIEIWPITDISSAVVAANPHLLILYIIPYRSTLLEKDQ